MKNPRVKICGITREEDARLAIALGATYLGFIFYEKSPRSISLEEYGAVQKTLPDGFRVAVDVHPTIEKVKEYVKAGFDFYQIHITEIHDTSYLNELSEVAGFDRLWLAPKLQPGRLFPESLFQYAGSFLMDTYQKDGFGGSGKIGDWVGFKQLNLDYPEMSWILAGGLSPLNIQQAVNQANPKIVDVNSGVEDSPGIKSSQKLKALFEKLRRQAD